MEFDKKRLENNFERYVGLNGEEVSPREASRYKWARDNCAGNTILDIGCSSGYGSQFLPQSSSYVGLDYSAEIIDAANTQNWGENRKFICADINTFDFGFYDTIIAFEIIEHLDNGLELAQKLKQHCNTLLLSVPYMEQPGFWGEHHKLHKLNKEDLPEFDYAFLGENGDIKDSPGNSRFNLMLCKWESSKVYSRETILCSISTYKRYDSTLPLTLLSILNQSKLPDKLVVFDDNENPIDPRNNQTYRYILRMMDIKGLKWEWLYAGQRGQHHNHQIANKMGYKWVWRIDDDCVAEPNTLETLCGHINDGVGAVGGSILTPPNIYAGDSTGKIDNIYSEPNIQWGYINAVKDVDHLHCSFLYRAGVVDYNLSLSRVAHREETIFTYRLKKAGYSLLVIPNAITWHMKNEGGIRGIDNANNGLFQHDEEIFKQELSLLNNTIVVLDCGMGDHVVFSNMMHDIKNPIIFSCYPDIVPGRSIEEARKLFGDISQYNIYKKMDQWNWKDSLESAFRKMYV